MVNLNQKLTALTEARSFLEAPGGGVGGGGETQNTKVAVARTGIPFSGCGLNLFSPNRGANFERFSCISRRFADFFPRLNFKRYQNNSNSVHFRFQPLTHTMSTPMYNHLNNSFVPQEKKGNLEQT